MRLNPLFALLLVAVYFLAGKFGLSFASLNASASAVWPPTGIALAACLAFGYRVWPCIFVGAFLVNVTTAGSHLTSLGIAAGNTLEALVGALLVGRFAGGVHVFDRAQNVLKFAGLASLGSTAISATVGVTTLALGGYANWPEFGPVWLTWWLGDVAGSLVAAPLALLWIADRRLHWSGARTAEAILALASTIGVSILVFGAPLFANHPLPFLCLAPLVWLALRFGVREVATGVGFLTIIATSATIRGSGPFVLPSENDSLLALQAFVATVAVMMLPVAALVAEHRRVAEEREALLRAAERERGRLEAAAEAQSRLAALVEGSDDAIIGKTLDGVITSWNRGAEKIFGYTADEALGQPITMIIPPERLAEEADVLATLRRSERVDPFDTIRLTKDRRAIPVSLAVSPIANDRGVIIGASTIASDITERVRRERTRRFLDETGSMLGASLEYDKILKTLPRLAVPTMADLCTVDVLTAGGAIERLGTAHVDPDKERLAHALVQRYPLTPSAQLGVPEVLRTGRSALYPEAPWWLTERARQTDEDREMLRALGMRSLMIVPMIARGRTLGAITFVSAESGRRYGEDDLVLAENLAQRAAIAIDNARLYTEAQDANRAKDEFLAVLSHELRTPLTSILGWARMMTTANLEPSRMLQAAAAIERNARLQAQLVNDLLDVSRIIAGKIELEMRPANLLPIIENAKEAPSRAAVAKGVHLEVQLDPSTGWVMGDPLRLEQVVTNLIDNAVKFTPAGGRVDVRLAPRDEHAELIVRDTGIGIERDVLPHIFERFRQADSRTTRRHGGLGLGLTIVRTLVEQHAGTVSVASAGSGQGTTFTVLLPIAGSRIDDTATSEIRDARRAARRRRRLDNVRVLLVEDDRDTRELVSDALTACGAEVRTAGDVDGALEIGRHYAADVLITDIAMPGKDGYDLLAAFRELSPTHRRIPLIALTALAGREHRTKVLAAGFERHVAKPIDPDDLVAIVAETVARGA